MCGIFALLNNDDETSDKHIKKEFIIEQFVKGKKRGPDNTILNLTNDIYLGFHRLSINGLDESSNQPFLINNIELICNGEIYNYKSLFKNIEYKAISNSDCEVIIHLYILYGIEYTLNLLDGVFAFVLIDHNLNKIFVSRDPYGVRPLYYLYNPLNFMNGEDDSARIRSNVIVFASEIKQLSGFSDMYNRNVKSMFIRPVMPGEFMCFDKSDDGVWCLDFVKSYTNFKLNNFILDSELDEYDEVVICNGIRDSFMNAVKKRVDTTERPIACLLSGGLDSSIVTSLVSKFYNGILETYSIGLKGSEDLRNAKIVANFLGTKHTEIIVSEQDFFDAIPEVIEAIESYDTTTVRASVGNYLVAKYISEHSEAKVIFNGDGSDELMGGYLYMNHADNHLEFDKECKLLLKDLHFFDVLRSDRSISQNGLEARTPFLDREFVGNYLSIPSNIRFKKNKIQEKYLFRKAFEGEYLPNEILWRRKEAFSDGVSGKDRSWFEVLEDFVLKQSNVIYNLDIKYSHNEPDTLEKLYYRTIFEKYYKNLAYLIPYFWMPKYVNASDSSARTLDIYRE